jgi:hypothetical protein
MNDFEVRHTFQKDFPFCIIDENGETVALFKYQTEAEACCQLLNKGI